MSERPIWSETNSIKEPSQYVFPIVDKQVLMWKSGPPQLNSGKRLIAWKEKPLINLVKY